MSSLVRWGYWHLDKTTVVCHALIPKEEVQEAETNELINKIYDGSADKLFAALLSRKKHSAEEIEKLKQIVADLEWGGKHEYAARLSFEQHCQFIMPMQNNG